MNLLNKVGLSIVDRRSAQIRHNLMSCRRSGAVHLQPCKTAKLYQRRSDSSRRTMNEHLLTCRDMRDPMHHLIGRDVVQHEAYGCGWINAIWNQSEFGLW